MKNIAIYARVSTGLQVSEGGSLDVQIQLCEKKIEELGLSSSGTPLVYREEGVSGEDIDRPILDRLRSEVASGNISHVIVTHPDRLTRDLTDKLLICREFEVHNVKLVFVDTDYQTTPEGLLFFNLMSVIAQYELSLIKKRTVRGRLRAVEKEKKVMPMRVAPFGYDKVAQTLVVNEEEADVVRKIYEWYIHDRLTYRQIGDRLYEMGVMPKRGESKNWGASSILRILKSEIYLGKYFYNRRRYKKVKGVKTKGGNPKKIYDIRNEDEWLMVPIPQIIDESVFELAQKQRKNNYTRAGNVKYEYLLKSILKCALCGRKWLATTYTGRNGKYTCYRCPNHTPKRYGVGVQRCPAKTIRGDLLDGYLWDLVMEFLSNPADYTEQLQATSELVYEELNNAVAIVERDIHEKEAEIERVKTLFRHGIINEEEMLAEFQSLRKTLDSLNENLNMYSSQLKASRQQQVTNNSILEITEKVTEFIEQGGQQLAINDKRFVIDTLIDEILVRYVDDHVVLTVIGHLGALQSDSEQTGVILQRSFMLLHKGYKNTKIIVPIEEK
ncbi:site-specific DNA recombinase [Paenibacillus phyllosphaerae]|uniref:Site-specific DNA recombinase n=1 Tax=Paenibacillus phyllosphaerae TaxID=274593 RepID=A0A7W5AT69_9BACL|nr:recombinase family protein [Paenibacillus phyllosphaerae]MBB3108167.1 site-specific DNA recombinase [Paenibacillus phyllosphaerae]